MEILSQEGSLTTPNVVLDPNKGLIELKGKSIPENSFDFYEPLYEWLSAYSEDPQAATEVNLAMEYFNTSSSKEFMKFFRKLEDLHKSGSTRVHVKWYHEIDDEEMMEMGESLKREVDIPLEILALEEL